MGEFQEHMSVDLQMTAYWKHRFAAVFEEATQRFQAKRLKSQRQDCEDTTSQTC